VTYRLKQKPADTITLSFKDAQGNEICTFKSKPEEKEPRTEDGHPQGQPRTEGQGAAPAATASVEGSGEAGVAAEVAQPPAKDDPTAKELKIPANAGWNRFIWDLRQAPATKLEGLILGHEAVDKIAGPVVPPGSYQATLTVGDRSYTATFEVIGDPGAPASQEDLQAQYDLLMQLHQKIDATITAINRMRDLRQQLEGWNKRAADLPDGKPIASAAAVLKDKVLEIEKTLLVPDLRRGWADSLNQGVRLLERIATLPSAVNLGNYRPTDQSYEVFKDLSAQIDAQIDRFNQLVQTDVAALNKQIADAQFGAVMVKA